MARAGRRAGTERDPSKAPVCIEATETGYIQLIDDAKLMEVACEADLVLRLRQQPGDFVRRGSTLFDTTISTRLDEKRIGVLRNTIAVGSRRTALQDMRFLIDELVEIAARALSPGVNDPFTASSCMDWLGAAIADLAGRELPSPLRADRQGALRVVAPSVTFAQFVDRAFGSLAQYASADTLAASRYLAVLGDVALRCPESGRTAVLRRTVERFSELAASSLTGPNKRAVIAQADDLLVSLDRCD